MQFLEFNSQLHESIQTPVLINPSLITRIFPEISLNKDNALATIICTADGKEIRVEAPFDIVKGVLKNFYFETSDYLL